MIWIVVYLGCGGRAKTLPASPQPLNPTLAPLLPHTPKQCSLSGGLQFLAERLCGRFRVNHFQPESGFEYRRIPTKTHESFFFGSFWGMRTSKTQKRNSNLTQFIPNPIYCNRPPIKSDPNTIQYNPFQIIAIQSMSNSSQSKLSQLGSTPIQSKPI